MFQGRERRRVVGNFAVANSEVDPFPSGRDQTDGWLVNRQGPTVKCFEESQ